MKNKEIKDIMMQLKKRYGSCFIDDSSSVEMGFLDEFKIIIVDGEIVFLIIGDSIIFTLIGLYKYKPEKYRVVVDMGAVGFVIKGADIMAPGIVSADQSIVKDDYVWVCDEKNFKPFAVGKALMSGEEMKHSQVGKAIQNIHFVGDRLWKLSHE